MRLYTYNVISIYYYLLELIIDSSSMHINPNQVSLWWSPWSLSRLQDMEAVTDHSPSSTQSSYCVHSAKLHPQTIHYCYMLYAILLDNLIDNHLISSWCYKPFRRLCEYIYILYLLEALFHKDTSTTGPWQPLNISIRGQKGYIILTYCQPYSIIA